MWNSVLGKENKGALRTITESSFWKEKRSGWFNQAFKTTWNKLLPSGCLLPSPHSHFPPPSFYPTEGPRGYRTFTSFSCLKIF